jgi:hypothetical protein
MANNHFLRKVAADELIDTLFFSTGNRVTKTRTPDTTTLSVPDVTIVIRHTKNIKINGENFTSVWSAKQKLQRMCV